MPYAENTKVTVDSSRGEITGILAKHGVLNMGWSTTPEGDQLLFELQGGSYRFNIKRPTAASMEAEHSADYRYPYNVDWEGKAKQEWMRRWRANVLLLKAKLEFIDGDASTLERELLPMRVLKNGATLEEFLVTTNGRNLLASGK